jgi:hypothetical protein
MAWSWGWHSGFLQAIWGSNLCPETGYPNGFVVLFSSYRKTMCRCLRLGYNLFLLHPFHFIIHYNSTIQRHTDRHRAFWNKQYLNNLTFHVSIVQDELLSKISHCTFSVQIYFIHKNQYQLVALSPWRCSIVRPKHVGELTNKYIIQCNKLVLIFCSRKI